MPKMNTAAPPPIIIKISNVHWVILFSLSKKSGVTIIALPMSQLESIGMRRFELVVTYFKNKILGLNYKQIGRYNGQ